MGRRPAGIAVAGGVLGAGLARLDHGDAQPRAQGFDGGCAADRTGADDGGMAPGFWGSKALWMFSTFITPIVRGDRRPVR